VLDKVLEFDSVIPPSKYPSLFWKDSKGSAALAYFQNYDVLQLVFFRVHFIMAYHLDYTITYNNVCSKLVL